LNNQSIGHGLKNKNGKFSLWNTVYGAFLKSINPQFSSDEFDLDGTIWNLKTFPTSFINWPYNNTMRLDIQISKYLSRDERLQMANVLPYDEIGFFKWNSSPYDLENHDDGHYEDTPSSWLLAYWMARYHGFIVEDTSKKRE